MSQRIHSWHTLAAMGLRTARLDGQAALLSNTNCIRLQLTRRSVSGRIPPRRASIQLDKSLWRLSNITRTVRRYLGAGENYVALLESHPTKGTLETPFI
jgi:hypothetical protein